MSEIALNAGVGRATLHRHFRGRDELIDAIHHQCLDETNAAVVAVDKADCRARDRLGAMLEAVIPLGDRFHFLRAESGRDPALAQRYQQELDWLRELVLALKGENEIGADVPTGWALAQIDQLVWCAWCEVSEGRLAAADAPALAVRTLLAGLK